MADEINATDLEQETISTLDGSEQFVMFDSVKGKRATVTAISQYAVGDKTQLTTTDKTSVVAAVNEVKGETTDLKEDLDDIQNDIDDIATIEFSPNLLDLDNITDNKYCYEGVLYNSTTMCVTDFIPVNENDVLHYQWASGGTGDRKERLDLLRVITKTKNM